VLIGAKESPLPSTTEITVEAAALSKPTAGTNNTLNWYSSLFVNKANAVL
jgi:hypothetical protein